MQIFIHHGAIALEVGQIRLREEHLPAVQAVDVIVEVQGGQIVVIHQLGVVTLLQLFDQLDNGFPLTVCVRNGGGNAHRQSRYQQGRNPQQDDPQVPRPEGQIV